MTDTPIYDCSNKEGYKWYDYNPDSSHISNLFENKVGFITDCHKKGAGCGQGDVNNKGYYKDGGRFEEVGYLSDANSWWQTSANHKLHLNNGSNPDISCQTVVDAAGTCKDDSDAYHLVCQKKEDRFEMFDTPDGWAKCCQTNTKGSANGGCHPDFYQGSKKCKEVCLGDSKLLSMSTTDTLKNDNLTCRNILNNTNKSDEEYVKAKLTDFCDSDVAYKDGDPVDDYTKMCGCYYEQNYYNNLIEKLKELYPNVSEHSYNDRTCFSSLCAKSPFKNLGISNPVQCPDQYFLNCINNTEFEVGGDMSGIELEQGNECNIYVEKGEYPFCGRSCENDNNCIDGDCNNCIDGKCKNTESVSCSNYTCPDDKITKSNVLCVGDSSTCKESDCCVGKPGGSSPSPSPTPSPTPSPSPDDNHILSISLMVLGGVLIFIGFILFVYNIYSNTKSTSLQQGGDSMNILGIIFGILLMIGGGISLYFGIDMYTEIVDEDDSDE